MTSPMTHPHQFWRPRRHPMESLEQKWLPGHRWVAEVDGQLTGWTAISPVSVRECYAGVGETSVYVAAGHRGRGVGKALLHKQVTAADAAGLWTLQVDDLHGEPSEHRAAPRGPDRGIHRSSRSAFSNVWV